MQLIEKKTGSGWRGPPGNAGWLGRGLQERKGNEGAGNCRIMRLIKNKNKEKKKDEEDENVVIKKTALVVVIMMVAAAAAVVEVMKILVEEEAMIAFWLS